jgi:hypothetical protein
VSKIPAVLTVAGQNRVFRDAPKDNANQKYQIGSNNNFSDRGFKFKPRKASAARTESRRSDLFKKAIDMDSIFGKCSSTLKGAYLDVSGETNRESHGEVLAQSIFQNSFKLLCPRVSPGRELQMPDRRRNTCSDCQTLAEQVKHSKCPDLIEAYRHPQPKFGGRRAGIGICAGFQELCECEAFVPGVRHLFRDSESSEPEFGSHVQLFARGCE